MIKKLTTYDIELVLKKEFSQNKFLIPHASQELGIHECDLLVVDHSNFAHEIEIKISASNLKEDIKKIHSHKSHLLQTLTFAVPLFLKQKALSLVPDHAGIILICTDTSGNNYLHHIRVAKSNAEARPLNESELGILSEVDTETIWSKKEDCRISGKRYHYKTGGRTNSYGEDTEIVSVRCPESRVDELKGIINLYLHSIKTK